MQAMASSRGSWAVAYRNSQGTRKEALRLLCTSGIVTVRELGDHLTVISDEHIDECVAIAVEMLTIFPHEVWMRQIVDAKRYFEGRITALYNDAVRTGRLDVAGSSKSLTSFRA
eukprot:gnl/TRDRNA2_/TRDRNA2_127877_c0_seq1.p1 gnl/TRDRNA2_/TRDRNA2_127877_c0~~gnl/TRDRNA2_/TRDRNA2_127877_c0_seq1.p1  ORF type:complete len:128 (+),score=16.75 gnl/TRDRNA2_/TRDRNA2_127877_c0_seq1:44-385(+)